MLDFTDRTAMMCVNVTVPVDTALEGSEGFDDIFDVTVLLDGAPQGTVMLGGLIIDDPPNCKHTHLTSPITSTFPSCFVEGVRHKRSRTCRA